MQLMLHYAKKLEEAGKSSQADKASGMVFFSLKCMARGGIHDHIGGGFHRYSVDECWHGECLPRGRICLFPPFFGFFSLLGDGYFMLGFSVRCESDRNN